MTFAEIIPHLINKGLVSLEDMDVAIVWGHLCWSDKKRTWRPYSPTKEDLSNTSWRIVS